MLMSVDVPFNSIAPGLGCAADGDATVTWPAADAGVTVSGACASGFGGSPQRTCSSSGVWLAPSGVACARGKCSPLDDGIASWLSTTSDTPNVAGTCKAGYTATGGNPPLRNCLANLAWAAVTNQCTRTDHCAFELCACVSCMD
jgi:hypothetical protein